MGKGHDVVDKTKDNHANECPRVNSNSIPRYSSAVPRKFPSFRISLTYGLLGSTICRLCVRTQIEGSL
jgi:hypothetical protein